VGKALYDRQLIDLPLAPLLLKHMVGDVAQDKRINEIKKPMTKVIDSISKGYNLPLVKLKRRPSPKIPIIEPKQIDGKRLSKPSPPPQKKGSVSNSDNITIPETDNGKLDNIVIKSITMIVIVIMMHMAFH
jgi:hypothetical protein